MSSSHAQRNLTEMIKIKRILINSRVVHHVHLRMRQHGSYWSDWPRDFQLSFYCESCVINSNAWCDIVFVQRAAIPARSYRPSQQSREEQKHHIIRRVSFYAYILYTRRNVFSRYWAYGRVYCDVVYVNNTPFYFYTLPSCINLIYITARNILVHRLEVVFISTLRGCHACTNCCNSTPLYSRGFYVKISFA